VVEEKEQKDYCTGVSTPNEVHSTEAVVECRGEMDEQLVGHNIEM